MGFETEHHLQILIHYLHIIKQSLWDLKPAMALVAIGFPVL